MVVATGGSGNHVQITNTFPSLSVQVLDSNSHGVSGVTVTFSAPTYTAPATIASGSFTGGAVVTTTTVTTDSNGNASVSGFQANTKAGTYSVTASASGYTSATFTLTNDVGPAAGISASAGGGQLVQFLTAANPNLAATVTDLGGNPVSGVTVTFTAPTSGPTGNFSGSSTATAVTNSSGIATAPTFTANSTAGSYTVTATAPGVSGQAAFGLVNSAGSASTIVTAAGTPQNVTILMAFGTALKAKVTDSANNAVANASVIFTAPTSGASGTFQGSGISVGVVTDASGFATAPTFTANGIAGTYGVVASVGNSSNNLQQATFTLTNNPGAASIISASAGTPQSTAVGTQFGTQLQAFVTDAGGNPIAGVSVTFAAPTLGASGTFTTPATVATDSAGHASVTFMANSTGGTYNVTATASGVTGSATFALTNATPNSIVASGGTPQNAPVLTAFGSSLQALVKDSGGNTLNGVPVTFTASTASSGASGVFSNNTNTIIVTTNSAGIASVPITANSKAGGPFTVSAAVSGLVQTASYSLTNLPGAASSLVLNAGSPQTTAISTPFASTLQVIVKDASGNPVPNVIVQFQGPPSGAGGTFANNATVMTATSGPTGIAASSIFTANTVVGSYAVAATVPNVPSVAALNFLLTNSTGATKTIAVNSGSPQSATILTAFGSQLQAIVKDSGGNPVNGATVTFTASTGTSGASGIFSNSSNTITATTLATGIASVSISANGMAGSFSVAATTSGANGQATFTLTNNVGTATQIAANAGSGQSTAVFTAFGTQLQAIVKDAGGNPVSGVTVTFKAPTSGASGTFAGSATITANTNVLGIATAPTFVANSTAGGYSVTATAPGVPGQANFALTNNASSRLPADPTAVGGTPQSTPVLTAFASPLQALVKDAGGNPLAGISVTFQAPSSGASGTFVGGVTTVMVTTGANGIATSPTFTANAIAGSYNVLASVSGVPQQAIFALTNIANGALSVVVTSAGKDGTFTFTANPSLGGISGFAITTSGGTASRSFQNLTGTYAITLGQPAFGYKLTSATCTSGTTSGNTVTVTMTPGASVTCTFALYFDSIGIRTTTQAAIKGFMQNRADAITSSQPRQTRGEGRFTGSLFGGSTDDADSEDNAPKETRPRTSLTDGSLSPNPNNPSLAVGSPSAQRNAVLQPLTSDKTSASNPVASPVALSGNDGLGGSTISAFVSLSAIRNAATQLDASKAAQAGLPYNGGPGGAGYFSGPATFDIWAEVQSNSFHSNYGNKQSGYTQLAYTGFDYLIHPAVLIGVMTQVDWASETESVAGTGANGFGWMVGPYTAMKLTPHITFDARAAWGQSTNNVNPFGIYQDAFNTERSLLSGRFSGNWKYGAWRFSPEASLVYFSESQKSFTDQLGVYIPSQTVSIGRFTFGPEVGYQIKQLDGAIYEPYLGLKGVYDFTKQDAVALDGSLTAPEVFRGKVEGGLTYKTLSGISVRGTASYDGLGAKGFENIQGQLSMRVPLN